MSNPNKTLEPGVQAFVDAVQAASGTAPAPQASSWPERRRTAEATRQPWCAGGPEMAQTLDMHWSHDHNVFRVRLYRPVTAPKSAPAIVYLHGGGWTLFSIDTHDRLMREYAHAAQAVVLGVDYALAPEHRFPVALDQCEATVRQLQQQARDFDVDPRRIALAGDSAGANLALVSAVRLRDTPAPAPLRGLLLNYGAFDPQIPEPIRDTLGTPDDMLAAPEMDSYWDNYLGPSPAHAQHPEAIPVHADLVGLPPVFLVAAEHDILTEQSRRMAQKLDACGTPNRLRVYPGTCHSFLEAVSVSAVAQAAIADGAQWLAEQLAPPGA